jgi:hypothetical protein
VFPRFHGLTIDGLPHSHAPSRIHAQPQAQYRKMLLSRLRKKPQSSCRTTVQKKKS